MPKASWALKAAGWATSLVLTFWIYKVSMFASHPAKTTLYAISRMLSERQNCSCHPLPCWKIHYWLPCAKGWSPNACFRRPSTIWPCFPYSSIFLLFSKIPMLSFSNTGKSRSYHLPALPSWDVYFSETLKLGQWHAPSWGWNEE